MLTAPCSVTFPTLILAISIIWHERSIHTCQIQLALHRYALANLSVMFMGTSCQKVICLKFSVCHFPQNFNNISLTTFSHFLYIWYHVPIGIIPYLYVLRDNSLIIKCLHCQMERILDGGRRGRGESSGRAPVKPFLSVTFTLSPRAEAPILGHLMQKLSHWKRPWCWERLKAGGEGNKRGWDIWMASPTHWTCCCSC